MNNEIRLIRARPKSYETSHFPDLSFGTGDRSHYNRRIALKVDYHKKEGISLHTLPWIMTAWKYWQKHSISQPDEINLSRQKT